MEIAAGQSRYQIARQPKFNTSSGVLSDRRGDMMLLINGMPVFHIELKKSGVSITQATNQIETYAKNGMFTGLFSLVQIFVAMNPEDCVYYANPGPEGKFDSDFYFRWADFNNEPITDWKSIASYLISIPMAHQLIGFYTVADTAAGVLKVMRSYQYYAAHAISDKVENTKWEGNNLLGGYIWHTTGSGKTMTSFKSAQLIANSDHADKVVFLMDRIELGTQTLQDYRSFAEESESVQETEDTYQLITKLKSSNTSDRLIVTSIQKMSLIKEENGLKAKDLATINRKRIVVIVDEAHRSTFGDMLIYIKNTFSRAIFFGFTGTPIHDENQRKGNTTADVFGSELHRYSIADGIRDKNVLGFDPYRITTFRDRDVRTVVALNKAKAVGTTKDEQIRDALSDPKKKKVYDKYMIEVSMAGYTNRNGKYIKGIEDFIPKSQYGLKHKKKVVEDIIDNWLALSQNGKFHAILTTRSIVEAIEYYRLIKVKDPELKITALFHPSLDYDDSPEKSKFTEEGLAEVIADYNARFEQSFRIAEHATFKKDVALRLAHKKPYIAIERTPDKQIDILIVVDQMLTGFDSKWINTLYVDKVLEYANVIQAFSRTNRLFGPDKPFGTIRYYRKPHTMERNIADAVRLYSGDKPLGLFVNKLPENIRRMNAVYLEICMVFTNAGVADFSRLPDDKESRGKFAKLFRELYQYLEAAKIQGFKWGQTKYYLEIEEQTYLILALRYKELFEAGGGGGNDDVPYDLEGYLTEVDTGTIDTDYMNSRFEKFIKEIGSLDDEATADALNELHKSFAGLTQEEQKYANLFLRDLQRGDVVAEAGKYLRDYITEYQESAKNTQITKIVSAIGVDKSLLKKLTLLHLTDININEFGRFDKLLNTVDKDKAKTYFESKEGASISMFAANSKVSKLLRDFLLHGGFDIDEI